MIIIGKTLSEYKPLFRSYLCDHIQHVKICETISNSRKVSLGLPHGIVLGPLLLSYSFIDNTVTFYEAELKVKVQGHLKKIFVDLTRSF